MMEKYLGKACEKCNGIYFYKRNEACVECTRREYHSSIMQVAATLELPTNRRDAVALESERYISSDICNRGHVPSVRDIRGRCIACIREKVLNNPRTLARKAGKLLYTPGSMCVVCDTKSDRHVSNNRCTGCHPITELQPSPRQRAIESGETWYVPTETCKKCGESALKRVYDGRCQGCNPLPAGVATISPRKAAIDKGAKWYMPDEPCVYCNKIELKRVSDGRCQGCNPVRGKARKDARMADKEFYLPDAACSACGLHAVKTAINNKCMGCRKERPLTMDDVEYYRSIGDGDTISRQDSLTLGIRIYKDDQGVWRSTLSNRDTASADLI